MSGPDKQPSFEETISVLRRDGLRVTNQRRSILRLLVDAGQPLSAEDIHSRIEPGSSDLVTVYRNLEAFEQAGIVQRVVMEKGRHLFELVQENHHHHHIICRKCHRAEKLDFCEVEKLETLAKNLGYSHVSHVLELYGICSECESTDANR